MLQAVCCTTLHPAAQHFTIHIAECGLFSTHCTAQSSMHVALCTLKKAWLSPDICVSLVPHPSYHWQPLGMTNWSNIFVLTRNSIPVSEDSNARQKENTNTFFKVKNHMLKSCRDPRHKQYRLGPVTLQLQAHEAFSQRRSEDGHIDKVWHQFLLIFHLLLMLIDSWFILKFRNNS